MELPHFTTVSLLIFSLKPLAQAVLIGTILACVLAIFSLIASAVCEVTISISHLWSTSDSITRLLLLCLAIYIIRKLSPYIASLHAKGLL